MLPPKTRSLLPVRLVRLAYLAIGFFVAAPALALTIDTTPDWNGTTAIGGFGETNTATYGQVITADAAENFLNSFTFFVDDRVNPDVLEFEAYVYAWNGSRATGSALFQSGPYSSTNNGGADGYEAFTVATGGVELVGGDQYVLFFSASNLFDGVIGTSVWAYINGLSEGTDYYTGGNFVFQNNGNDFGALTTNNWFERADSDLAFIAEFGSTADPIPEPGTAMMLFLGLGWMGVKARR